MFTNLQLFPDPSSGKSNRQMKFEGIYLGYGIDLMPVMTDAHRKTLEDASREAPEFINKSYWAQNMNRNMVGLLKQRYPELVKYDEEGRAYINLDDEARIYLKKLDNKFRPNNIPTRHVIDLNTAQGQLFGRDLAVLYVGPRLRQDGIWDEVDCFMVEMRNTRRCDWVSDLSDLSSRMGGSSLRIVPPPTTPTVPPVVSVKLKDKQLGKGSDQEQAASN